MSILRDASRSYLRSVVIYGIAALIGIPCMCLFVFLPLWYVNENNVSGWYLLLPFGLFLLILFGGGFGTLAWMISWRARQLNALFEPLGLAGSSYATYFRQYHGNLAGREARVYFSRGPLVEIELACRVPARLGVCSANSDTAWLASAFNQAAVDLHNPELSDVAVFAKDAAWARQLLAQPAASELLRELTTLQGSFTRQHVTLRPGWLRLTLFGSRRMLDFNFDITPQQAGQWVNALNRLAALAESLPAPAIAEEASGLERTAEKVKNRNPYLVPVVTVVVTFLFIFCTAGAIITWLLLLEG